MDTNNIISTSYDSTAADSIDFLLRPSLKVIDSNIILNDSSVDNLSFGANWCSCVPDWTAIVIAVVACVFTILSYYLIKDQVIHEITSGRETQKTNQGILNGVLSQNEQQKEIMKTIEGQTEKVLTFATRTKVETKTKECMAMCIAQLNYLKKYFEAHAGRVFEDVEQAKLDTNQSLSTLLQNAIIIKANSATLGIPTDVQNVANKCISLKDLDENYTTPIELNNLVDDIETWINIFSIYIETK